MVMPVFLAFPMPKRSTILAASAAVGAAAAITVLLIRRRSHRNRNQPPSLEQVYTEIAEIRGEICQLRSEISALKRSLHVQNGPTDEVEAVGLVVPVEAEQAPELHHAHSGISTNFEFFDASDTFEFHSNEELFERSHALSLSEEKNDRNEAYEILEKQLSVGKNHEDPQFLWRLARCVYCYSTLLPKGDKEKENLLIKARNYALKASNFAENDADVYKWAAITTGASTEFVDTKEKIKRGYEFKEFIDKALHVRNDEALLYFLKGRWCFDVANLDWFSRNAAKMLFGEPPSASFQEALDCFKKAQTLSKAPNSKFSTAPLVENQLYLAKTYLKMDMKEDAVEELDYALKNLEAKSEDEKLAMKEMENLLEKCGK